VQLEGKKIRSNVGDDSSDNESDEYDDEHGKQKGQSVCNVCFSNLDLANLVNGWPGNPIEKRPFDSHFTSEGTINSWIAVGVLPMMGITVNNPKVRH